MHEVVANEGKPAHMGEIKAITTLRNGKQVISHLHLYHFKREMLKIVKKDGERAATEQENEDKASKEGEKKPGKVIIKEGSMAHHTLLPFPNELKGKKKVNHYPEIF